MDDAVEIATIYERALEENHRTQAPILLLGGSQKPPNPVGEESVGEHALQDNEDEAVQ